MGSILPPSLTGHLLQVAAWLRQQQQHRHEPLVVGISGGQGTGKSTWAAALGALLPALGLTTATLSLDDFYLPLEARRRLQREHPGDPYLQWRGGPGTHDLALMRHTLDALRRVRPRARTALPRFDKALRHGQGERLPRNRWPRVAGRPGLVFLEGWFVGARPLARPRLDRLKARYPELMAFERECDPDGRFGRRANRRLRAYGRVFSQLDLLIYLKAPDLESVLRWRMHQERALRRVRGGGMPPAEVRRFVRTFLLLTAVHGLSVLGDPGSRQADLIVELGDRHRVLGCRFRA